MSKLETFTARHFVESIMGTGERQLDVVGGFHSWYAPPTIRKVKTVVLSTGTIKDTSKKYYKEHDMLFLENCQPEYLEEVKENIRKCRTLQAHAQVCFRRARTKLESIAFVDTHYSD